MSNLTIDEGDLAAIMGASGSGKSTMMTLQITYNRHAIPIGSTAIVQRTARQKFFQSLARRGTGVHCECKRRCLRWGRGRKAAGGRLGASAQGVAVQAPPHQGHRRTRRPRLRGRPPAHHTHPLNRAIRLPGRAHPDYFDANRSW
jgi:energy-coupling factor transporter ATP-binding protein EcfA2